MPILGLIENMSTHVCTHCGYEEHIFGHGGAQAEAEKRGVPYLGAVPLSMEIREFSDKGEAAVLPEGLIDKLQVALRSKV